MPDPHLADHRVLTEEPRIHVLNLLDGDAAREWLLGACGSMRWAAAVSDMRPFTDKDAVLAGAEHAFTTLTREDWLEAFAAHARIGERQESGVHGAVEQAGVAHATEAQLSELRAGNNAYEERFGHAFLIRARGLDTGQMLAALRTRLRNTATAELELAAGQQREITGLRLREMLAA